MLPSPGQKIIGGIAILDGNNEIRVYAFCGGEHSIAFILTRNIEQLGSSMDGRPLFRPNSAHDRGTGSNTVLLGPLPLPPPEFEAYLILRMKY